MGDPMIDDNGYPYTGYYNPDQQPDNYYMVIRPINGYKLINVNINDVVLLYGDDQHRVVTSKIPGNSNGYQGRGVIYVDEGVGRTTGVVDNQIQELWKLRGGGNLIEKNLSEEEKEQKEEKEEKLKEDKILYKDFSLYIINDVSTIVFIYVKYKCTKFNKCTKFKRR